MRPMYHRWLHKDLKHWVAKGWVTADGAAKIRNSTKSTAGFGQLQTLVGLLGAVLLVFAAITFVAANWSEMSRLLRLGLLFSAMWTAFGAAWWLQTSSSFRLSEAFVLTGVGLFGANIVLISQMYHLDGRYPDALFLWGLGALVAAFLLWSRAALAIGFIAMTIWTSTEALDFGTVFHWQFLILWFCALALAWLMRWSSGGYLAMSSLMIFILITITAFTRDQGWHVVGATVLTAEILLAITALGFMAQQLAGDGVRKTLFDFDSAGVLASYGLALFLIVLFWVQLSGNYRITRLDTALAFTGSTGWVGWSALFLGITIAALIISRITARFTLFDQAAMAGLGVLTLVIAVFKAVNVWVFGAFFLTAALWVAAFGQRREESHLVNLGLAAFGTEILYVYFKLFETMAQTSLFFLVGGVLLMGLAFGMSYLRKLFQIPSDEKEEISS